MSGPSSAPQQELDSQNPWPGLWPYDERAKEYFFGRQAETDALFRLVRREPLV